MQYEWNEKTLAWFENASEYTGYSRELAKLLLPYLEGCRTLCDIGCGMALADFELADRFDTVYCVDVNETAIRYVREKAEKSGVSNLFAIAADGMDGERIRGEIGRISVERSVSEVLCSVQGNELRPGAVADAVMALFHGDIEEIGEQYLSYVNKKLILVVHGSSHGTTGPEKYRIRKCCDVDHTKAWLDTHGLAYEFQKAELEFGQPHKSLEDAMAYTEAFTKKVPTEELVTYVKAHVTETGRADYPLYTPKIRKFGIFSVDVTV